MTFMNESGAAVVPLVRRGGIDADLSRLLVVHDELDLAPGRLQLKLGGGLAGHNGLRSIAGALGTEAFARLRVGIGKPPSRSHGQDWVLSRAKGSEGDALDRAVLMAADALEDVVANGVDAAAGRLNGTARG
jgi:PTH1 family peptidyl-tRNA hydrolase